MQGVLTRLWELVARERQGVAAVEFAIIAPALIILLAGAANIGFAADHAIRLANAARAGAQYATVLPADGAGAQGAAQAIVPGATVTVSPMVCTCPVSGATGGATVGCNTACATGMARYITVAVSMPPPQIPGLAFATGIAASRSVVARVQ